MLQTYTDFQSMLFFKFQMQVSKKVATIYDHIPLGLLTSAFLSSNGKIDKFKYCKSHCPRHSWIATAEGASLGVATDVQRRLYVSGIKINFNKVKQNLTRREHLKSALYLGFKKRKVF